MITEDKKELFNSEENTVECREDELLEEIEETVTATALGCASCCS